MATEDVILADWEDKTNLSNDSLTIIHKNLIFFKRYQDFIIYNKTLYNQNGYY